MGNRDAWLVNVTRISDGTHVAQKGAFARLLTEDELAEFAEDWILDQAGNNEPDPTLCDACRTHLVRDKAIRDTDYQFDNALWMEFHGGYGMFIDPIGDPGHKDRVGDRGRVCWPQVVICHECAHDLCDKVPWIGKLLNPEGSHSHRTDDHDRLKAEGHKGWDLS